MALHVTLETSTIILEPTLSPAPALNAELLRWPFVACRCGGTCAAESTVHDPKIELLTASRANVNVRNVLPDQTYA